MALTVQISFYLQGNANGTLGYVKNDFSLISKQSEQEFFILRDFHLTFALSLVTFIICEISNDKEWKLIFPLKA